MTNPINAQEEEIWCGGLPLAFRRPLAPEEQDSITRYWQKHRRWYGAVGVAIPLLLVILFVSVRFIFQTFPPETAPLAAALAALVGILILIALLFLGWLEGSNIRGLTQDRTRGMVLHFEGVMQPNEMDAVQKAFLSPPRTILPALIRDTQSPQSLEILAGSKRVWTINDQPAFLTCVFAHPRHIAKTPEFAAIAEQWLQPVPTQGNAEEVLSGQRDLSPAEKQELRQASRRVWQPHLLTSGLLTAWFVLSILVRTGSRPWYESGGAWFFLIMTLLFDTFFVFAVLAARRLLRDALIGKAIIVRRKMSVQQTTLRPDPNGQLMTVEILPFSRRLWTREGKPAPWRTAATANNAA